jgi:hypothetical protein
MPTSGLFVAVHLQPQDGPDERGQINGKTSDMGTREGLNGTTEETMLERSHGNSDLGGFSPGPRPSSICYFMYLISADGVW